MSDRNGGYTMNAAGFRACEDGAMKWAKAARKAMDVASTPSQMQRAQYMPQAAYGPSWLESDEDYETFASECRMVRPRCDDRDCARLGIPRVTWDEKSQQTMLGTLILVREDDTLFVDEDCDGVMPEGPICDVNGMLII